MRKMRKMKERIVSLALTFVMVMSLWVGMAPVEVHAEGDTDTIENVNIQIEKTGENTYQISGVEKEGWKYAGLSEEVLGEYNYTISSFKEYYKEMVSSDEPLGLNAGILDVKNLDSYSITVGDDAVALIFGKVYEEMSNFYWCSEMAWFDLPANVGDKVTSSLGTTSPGGGNVNPPVADSCTVTIDSTKLAEGALLAALRFDSDGYEMGEPFELTNGSTVEIPKDGGLLVMSNSSNFKVTVSDTTLANVGDLMVGDAESGYYISEIKGNITVVVESTTPTTDSCTVTIDSTKLAEGALLAALRFDSDGYEMGEPFELTNGSTVEIPKDGGLLVMSNSSNFKVTVSDTTLANVGDLMVGDAESGYYISEIKGNITVVVESTTQGGGNENPPAGGDGVTGDISSVTITNHIFDDIFADIQDGTLNSYSNEDLYLHAWPKVTVLNKNGEVLKTYINNPYIAHRTNSGWEVCDCGNTLNDSEHGILLLFQTDYNHGNDQEDLTSIVSIDSDTLVIDKAWADYSIYPRTGAIYVAIVPGTSGGNENPPATDTYDITLDRTNYADGYVDLYTYDGEGRNVENTQKNNDTITMPEGGKVRVFADSEFTVTAEGATISEMLSAGDEGYYYELTGITADTTIVVNLKQNTPVVVAPAITSQPQNISVQEGQKAIFSVTATGDNLSYQWQIDRNDGNGFVNLSGATSASYTTSTVDMDCNGFKYQCIVSNEGGSVTTNIATLTVTESSSVHTHSLTLVPAKAATCTTAGNKAYYTCSGCDSLFADANGTTITTAETVKVAALDHDWTGEWTISKEATATEDGKKETLCTRGCGQKKVAIIPATGTSDDNGNLEKDAEVEPDAPIDDATLNNSKEELLEADNIFTDAEKTLIENGADARVWLEIGKTNESTIVSTDKEKVEQEAAKIMGDNVNITYFEADLFKQVGTTVTEIREPGVAIKITIKIPDELLNSDKKVSREYKIVRLHEGQVDVLNGTFNSATGEFTFETDKFSPYAIVYKDVAVNNPTPGNNNVIKSENDKKDEVPKTGESNTALYSFVFMLVSGLGVVICSRKKRF